MTQINLKTYGAKNCQFQALNIGHAEVFELPSLILKHLKMWYIMEITSNDMSILSKLVLFYAYRSQSSQVESFQSFVRSA